MAKVAVGSIPEKICYVFSGEHEVHVGCEWDIDWYESDDKPKAAKEKVIPAFPIDDSDEKSRARAIKWAEQNYYRQSKKTAKFDTVDNVPTTGVKVFSLEQRSQGGRAYKAVIGKYYVDLREDVLMDTMLKAGVQSGGILLGEYVWAKMGSQMKLVRVGSELHRLIMEFESKKDIKPVGKNDLEIGGVYQDRKKNKAIFVGYVNTVVYKSENTIPYWQRTGQADFKYKKTPIKKAMLFFELYDHVKQDLSIDMKKESNDHQYKIKKSHTYIEKVDQVKIPDGIVEHLRNKSVKEAKEKILEYTGHKNPKQNVQRIDAAYLENHIEYVSDHLNLYEFNGVVVEPFDVKKFLLFS